MSHNSAIRDGFDCFKMLPSEYNASSYDYYDYGVGFECSSKIHVDENESNSCSTSPMLAEIDGKLGHDELSDLCSDQEYYEKKENNVVEAKIEKRGKPKKPKVVVTVDSLGKADMLRQILLEYVFQCTGRLVTGKVLKLTPRHEREKIIRFNEICPQHIVAYCIENKCGKKRNHFPLCIDKCSHCPSQTHRIFDNMAEWLYVKSSNPSMKSYELRNYISLYSNKQTRGQFNAVVKYSDLRLNVYLFNSNTTQPLISQQHKVKIMKEDYFDKIRTATPKAPTQPLNLTYARFWVEIVKDCVYLCIVDVAALKDYYEKQGPKRPIKSVVGAYVDGRMEVELAIMSSFSGTDVVFEWFVRKDYMNHWGQNGFTLGLQLTGNKEMNDWNWYETVRGTNVVAYNNASHNQWSSMGYNPSGASFDCFLPQVIQPMDNSYKSKWPEANYRMQETIAPSIGCQNPITNYANGTSMPIPPMSTPSPTLKSTQIYDFSLSTLDNMTMGTIQNNTGKKHGIKRKRNEMESETDGRMEAQILPFPSKRPVGSCQEFYGSGLTLSEENPQPFFEENLQPLFEENSRPFSKENSQPFFEENPLSLFEENHQPIFEENPLSLFENNYLPLIEENPLSLFEENSHERLSLDTTDWWQMDPFSTQL